MVALLNETSVDGFNVEVAETSTDRNVFFNKLGFRVVDRYQKDGYFSVAKLRLLRDDFDPTWPSRR